MNSPLPTIDQEIAREVCLGPLEQIPPGEGREFHVHGQLVALFHSRNGSIYATQALCPHRSGPLSDGLMGGNVIVCPFHSHKFDLVNGASLSGDCDLKTYPVRRAEDGKIYIAL